jgi:hypothetical protein
MLVCILTYLNRSAGDVSLQLVALAFGVPQELLVDKYILLEIVDNL